MLYSGWVALLALATGIVVKRSGWRLGREKVLFIFLFTYALILPRFKDYSYMLVIIPSWYVAQVVLPSLWAKLVAAAALCIGSAPLAEVAKALLGVGVIHGSVLLDRLLPAAVEFVVSYKSLLILAALYLLCLHRWSRAVAWRFGGSPPWIAANVLDPWELKGAGRG
jgi:hypothetical protein